MTGDDYLKDQDWDSAIVAFSTVIGAYEANPKTTPSTQQQAPTSTPPTVGKAAEAYRGRGYARCFTAMKDEDYREAIGDLSKAIVLFTSTDGKNDAYLKRAYAY